LKFEECQLELDEAKTRGKALEVELAETKERAGFFESNYQSLAKFKKYLPGYNMDKLASVLAMGDADQRKLDSLATMLNHCDKQERFYRQCLAEERIARKTIGIWAFWRYFGKFVLSVDFNNNYIYFREKFR
jgi:hypothetical protein